jgi:Tfp pilus assembly PilM family ATPase
MGTRNALAIDLGRRRLRAVQASSAPRRSIHVRGVLVCDVPPELPSDDASAMGAWLAQRLRDGGFVRGPATLSIGREHVIVKRISLPTVDVVELPDMTRLAMQRELPFDAESAVIDFVTVERHESSTTVLAVAVPRKQVDFVHAVAEAAGLKVHRIALRTMGAVALINAMEQHQSTGVRVEDVGRVADDSSGTSSTNDEPAKPQMTASPATLAVDVVGEGVEFCVLSDGSIRFSRAAEVPAPQDDLAMAEAVVTEARRTWMSYRSGEETGGIGEAIIMGDRRIAQYAAGPVGEMLRMPVRVLCEHPRVEAADADLTRVWPLIGLLLESENAGEHIDFLHPRKTPDVGARTRQRRLLAAAAAIIVGGAAFTLMRQDLQAMQATAATLAAKGKSEDGDFARHYRDSFRVQHLKEWQKVKVDWLDHAMFLARVAPRPDQIVLDSWAGTLEAGDVRYERDRNRWFADHQATIVIDGEARNRATADAFRGSLIQNPSYAASTTGADTRGGKRMPFGFTYRIRTRASGPPSPESMPAETSGQRAAGSSFDEGAVAPGNAGGDETNTPPIPSESGAAEQQR